MTPKLSTRPFVLPVFRAFAPHTDAGSKASCNAAELDRYSESSRFLATLANGAIVYKTSESFKIQQLVEQGKWNKVPDMVTLAQKRPYDACIEDVISLIAYYEGLEDVRIPTDVIRATFKVDTEKAGDVTDMCDVIAAYARLTKALIQNERWHLVDELLSQAKHTYRSGSRKAIANQILKLGKQNIPSKTYELAKQVRPWFWFGLAWRTFSIDKFMVID
jgi:hypothetical protein